MLQIRTLFLACVLTLTGICSFAQEIQIVPKPQTLVQSDGAPFAVTAQKAIVYSPEFEAEANYLSEIIAQSTGMELAVKKGGAKRNAINIIRDTVLVKGAEAYRLDVTSKQVNIYAAGNAGAFYGIQSLLQLLPSAIYSPVIVKNVEWNIPAVQVEDAPAYPWRGMMLDVARYFYPKEFVMKYIDMMAMYKMNYLHLHLIDDSGWRLEIKKYPELTKKGAWTTTGPDRIGGFYTQDDVREMVAYGQLRNVEIIPEIAFPAHMLSAVVAYPWLSCRETQEILPNKHFISRDLLCVGKESSFQFLEDVFAETVALFPSKYFHIGGDEAVYTHWEKCPKCQKVRQEQGLKSTAQLQGYLTDRVCEMLKKYNKTVVGWHEVVQRGDLKNQVVSMVWTNLNYAKQAIDKGHMALLAPAGFTYFDFPESNKKGEPQAATWMPPISLEKCYSLKVEQYNQNNQTIGVHGCYWSDQLIHGTHLQEIDALNENRSENYAEYLSFPRVLALSEVGWTQESLRDYNDFANRMKGQYAKLERKNCHYRCPEPNLDEMKEDANGVTFTLSPSVANSKIVYTTDGSYPHAHSDVYTGPVTVAEKEMFRASTVTESGKVSLPLYRESKYGKFKEYGELTAEWTPAKISGKEFATWKFEATGKISGNGVFEISFWFTSGEYKLDIEEVKLYKRDELVGTDTHVGYTGGSNKDNIYTIEVTNFEAGTPFYIEAKVRGDLGNNSNGAVFIRKVK
ncbi:MAG: beta-N-acetylhexosaminidase [Marinifilaceae bacterium]